MKSFYVASFVLILLVLVRPAYALDADSDLVRSLARQVSRSLITELAPLPSRTVVPTAATLPAVFSISPAPVVAASFEPLEAPLDKPARPSSTSKAFPILASTYVALNAVDIYTTTKAISSARGVEANPVLAPIASTPVALTAAKIATTATTLVLARRLWKQHRAASITLLVAANIGMGVIAGHNAQVMGRF